MSILTGLRADRSIVFRHFVLTFQEVAALLGLEEPEGLNAQPPIRSEEALPQRRFPLTPTWTVATEEGSQSTHSDPSARMDHRRTLRRFFGAVEPFTAGARPKGETAPP